MTFAGARSHGVGTQAILLAVATGLAQVVLAIIYVVAARTSSVESFGLMAAAIALGMAAVGFFDFGTNSLWVRERARGVLELEELGSRMFGKVVLIAIACSVWAVVCVVFLPKTELWIAAPVALAIVLNQTSQVPLRSIARGERVAVSIFTDRCTAGVVFGLLMLMRVPSLQAVWIAIVCGSLAAAAMGWLMCPVSYRPHPRLRMNANPWRGSQFYGLSNLAVSGQALDLPLLALVAGSASAGVYGAVSRWTQPMGLLAAAFASASAPFVARAGELPAAWRVLRRGIWMPAIAVVLSVAVFFLAQPIVQILLGQKYSDSASILQVLALVAIPSIICQPLSVALQSLGRDRFVAISMAVLVSVQLIAVWALGSHLGALGAAIASLGTQIVLLCILSVRIFVEARNHRRSRVLPSAEMESDAFMSEWGENHP